MPWLFSYGTLRQREVQVANFGRELAGHDDELVAYTQTLVEITDARVVELSGSAWHPIVAPSTDPDARVAGTVFELTDSELAAADDYEVDDYTQVEVTLASGTSAWVYLDKRVAGGTDPAHVS
jgi:gamma-glutamylcyclotransferase (GGCT)/AIG2-like uncharacterized protein YtfP